MPASEDAEWRAYVVSDTASWAGGVEPEPVLRLGLYREAVLEASRLRRTRPVIERAADVGVTILAADRVDELDRWLPQPSSDEAWYPEWLCLVACRVAALTPAGGGGLAAALLEASRRGIEDHSVAGAPPRRLLDAARAYVARVR